MKNTFVLLSLFGFMLTLNACAFVSQKAVLRPQLAIASSDVGKGKEISLKVVDERPKKTLGRRGTVYGAAAEISSDQEISDVVYDKISEGLKAYGFSVVAVEKQVPLSMKVEVRHLEYTTSTGFWSGGVHTTASLKVLCKNGARDFEDLYRQENEERVVIVPTAEKNEELLNNMLSQVLTKIFMDRELLTFLGS